MQLSFFTETQKKNFLFSGNYFFYFLVLGVYFPYFPLYCYKIGFSEKEVGMISGLRTFASIFFPLGWAFLVDRFHLHRFIFLFCHTLAVAAWSLFFFADTFFFMMFIMGLYGFFHSPIIGFMEAFTVNFLGKKKSGYGGIRVWGSVGFIFSVWGCGFLLDFWPSRTVLWLVLSGSLVGVWMALKTPVSTTGGLLLNRGGLHRLLTGNGLLFLFIAFVMVMSHGAYYGFFSIHLSEAGFSGSFIGFTWALASLAEIVVMLGFRRIFKRFSLKKMMLFSLVMAVIRWLLLAFSIHPLVILFSQILHAFTYGVFHMAAILFMDALVDPGAKTLGQTLLNATSYGVGLMMGYVIGGLGFASLGEGMFVISALMALVGGGCAVILQNPESSVP
ncbi:MFS transporter [Desulfobotulus sp.]|uniref:MFS transporter n=1 Tax=Desulfobotulus sp. TaxID=1940337 RepID=UPI002A362BC5|nr:MFS transporter [Desulfobotulus sp.]MDY0163476.1 MFS transporter [Desulfobotulus sp.]